MNMINQEEALSALHKYAERNRQAVLISGPEGCGKSYLAKQYSSMLNIPDFQIIECKMDSVREAMEACLTISNPIVLCIENLDNAVASVSYAILKFLEEPKHNVYIVVTCRNVRHIPDTILSRCVSIDVPPMIQSDLKLYAETYYTSELSVIKENPVMWACINSISDMAVISKLDADQISYIINSCGLVDMQSSVSNIVWKLQHFPDKNPTPIALVVRYLMHSNVSWKRRCLSCLDDLSTNRLGVHAVLSKLVLELKYGDDA